MRVFKPRKCVVCGKEFAPTASNRISCSPECQRQRNFDTHKAAYIEKMAKRPPVKCECCGVEIDPGRNGRRQYCPACSKNRQRIQYQAFMREHKDRYRGRYHRLKSAVRSPDPKPSLMPVDDVTEVRKCVTENGERVTWQCRGRVPGGRVSGCQSMDITRWR